MTPATDATTLASSKDADDSTLVGENIEIRVLPENASNKSTILENSNKTSTGKATSLAIDNNSDENRHNGKNNPSDGKFLAKSSGRNSVKEKNGIYSDNSANNAVISPNTGKKFQNGLNASNNAAQISKNSGNGSEDEQIKESAATIGGNKDKAENSGSSCKETGEKSEILTKLTREQKYLGDESGTAARDPTCMHHDHPTLDAGSSDDNGSISIGSGTNCNVNTVVAKKSVHFYQKNQYGRRFSKSSRSG